MAECEQPAAERRSLTISEDQLSAALEQAFIRALESGAAEAAVSGAINKWFDKQSGKAMRSLMHSLIIGSLVICAIKLDSFKQALLSWVK